MLYKRGFHNAIHLFRLYPQTNKPGMSFLENIANMLRHFLSTTEPDVNDFSYNRTVSYRSLVVSHQGVVLVFRHEKGH